MIKFYSKKNEVVLNDSIVIKKHLEKKSYEREKYFLKTYSSKDLLFYDDESLTFHMIYIEGKTLLEILEESEKVHDIFTIQSALLMTMDKLNEFHETYGYAFKYKDVNFRNFIVSNDIHIIDFEDACQGDYKEDYIDLAAMLVLYEPERSEFKLYLLDWIKTEICRRINFDDQTFDEKLSDSINNIKKRRQ